MRIIYLSFDFGFDYIIIVVIVSLQRVYYNIIYCFRRLSGGPSIVFSDENKYSILFARVHNDVIENS